MDPSKGNSKKDPPSPGGKGGAKPKEKKYVRPTCSVDGCTSQTQHGGVCKRHGAKKYFYQCKIEGCNNHVKRGGVCVRHGATKPKCSVDGCNNDAKKGGVCHSHGAKKYICKVAGCNNNVKKRGLCQRHGAEVKTCSDPECTNQSKKEGLCKRHYNGKHGAEAKKCSAAEGCKSKAHTGGLCRRHHVARQRAVSDDSGDGDGAKISRKQCKKEGCTNFAQSGLNGHCRGHSNMRCNRPECPNKPYSGGLCKRHFDARQQQVVSADSDNGDGGQVRRATKRSRRSTETEMASVEEAQRGMLGHQAGQENPRQQVEQVGHQHGASLLEISEQPAPAGFNETSVAHDPYDEVVSNEGTIEFNGNSEREAESAPMPPFLPPPPLPPPTMEETGTTTHIFDKYDGDKVDMTQDNGNEDCIEPESSKKGVEYVLKVAEKVVEVKREQIEETKEAKVAAETRAAAAEEVAMEARRALEAATKTKKLTNRILLRSGAGNDEKASEEVEGECCMVCCEPYEAEAHRSRVVCSADDGCGSFAMCRLCVFRSSIILEDPVQIDNEASYGAFDYDTTVCPQCRKEGAFQEDELPDLPGDVKRAVEAEIWEGRDREQIAAAQHAFEDGNDEDDGDYEG
ncbi:hypothetical protein ACHAXT_008999 [Thalassiosira profunda]